jgi:hypothetical protein
VKTQEVTIENAQDIKIGVRSEKDEEVKIKLIGLMAG